MSDASPKKSKKPAAKPSHPTYRVMITTAITALKERSGSSRQAIVKYLNENNNLSNSTPAAVNAQVRKALKKGVEDKYFTQTKGKGASGSFKLAVKEKKVVKKVKKVKTPKKAAAPKKAAVKKTAAKKKATPKKKTPAKKTAAKKTTTKKPAKKPAKKPTAKKVKKPIKKKTAAKKTAKK